MLDRDSIINIVKSKADYCSLSQVNDMLRELCNLNLEIITFKCNLENTRYLNDAHVILGLKRLNIPYIDDDIEDLLDLTTYSVAVSVFLDKRMNGKNYEFKASLAYDATTYNRLKGIIESINTINISRIDQVISKDCRNNKWNIELYNCKIKKF